MRNSKRIISVEDFRDDPYFRTLLSSSSSEGKFLNVTVYVITKQVYYSLKNNKEEISVYDNLSDAIDAYNQA